MDETPYYPDLDHYKVVMSFAKFYIHRAGLGPPYHLITLPDFTLFDQVIGGKKT